MDVYFSRFYRVLTMVYSAQNLLLLLLLLLFTAIEFAPGGSSPTLVQTKTMKQHCTVIRTQYNNTYTVQ
jgi:hypothetical protein